MRQAVGCVVHTKPSGRLAYDAHTQDCTHLELELHNAENCAQYTTTVQRQTATPAAAHAHALCTYSTILHTTLC